MTRTLYLHIGMHKTGTTSLQNALAANMQALADQDFAYVTGRNDNNLHEFVTKLDKENLATTGFHMRKPEEFIRVLTAPTAPRIIASSESMSYFFHRTAVDELAELLRPHFDDIRIISYLRRQDQLAISHHQEGAKPQNKPAARIYGHSPTALPQQSEMPSLYLDYETRIGHWADVFGEAAITLRIFDRKFLKNGDAIADFLDVAGIDPSNFIPTENLNVSMGLGRTKVGHILNELVEHQQTKMRILSKISDDEKLLPRRDDAVRYVERYAAGNAALNARFKINDLPGLFSDDFSAYPENGNEDWTEKTADTALRAFAQVVDSLSKDQAGLTAEELRDVAGLYKATKPELAMKFLRAALVLRPEGNLIKQRIVALQDQMDGKGKPAGVAGPKGKGGGKRKSGRRLRKSAQAAPASPEKVE